MSMNRLCLNIHIPPSQSTVAGMVFLMEHVKICKGAPCDSSNSECEQWSIIGNENTYEFRKRSHTCQRLLSFSSKVEFCEPCAQKLKRESKQLKSAASNVPRPSALATKRKQDTSDTSFPIDTLEKNPKGIRV